MDGGEVIRRETVNDLCGMVANFWRSVQRDPDVVAHYADWIVHELDLHARGDWLFCRPESKEFVERMRADEGYYCVKTAGYWCWFVSNWIGPLPSVEKNVHRTETSVHKRRPHLSDAGNGVSRQRPHLADAGKGVSRQIRHLGGAGKGECARRAAVLVDWMQRLSDRLRNVRVCCGNWDRILGPSVTWNNAAPVGVFLDPPYLFETTAGKKRDDTLYGVDSGTVAHDVRAWCLANGDNPDFRIALCGYEGEHDLPGWSVHAWKASGGYARGGNSNGLANRHRERIWFSPHCLNADAMRYPLFFESKLTEY